MAGAWGLFRRKPSGGRGHCAVGLTVFFERANIALVFVFILLKYTNTQGLRHVFRSLALFPYVLLIIVGGLFLEGGVTRVRVHGGWLLV